MHVHTCGSPCSHCAAHVKRCTVTVCMPKSLALYHPESSTTAHTSHRAHAMLHWLSPSRSLAHSTVASLWHAQLCGMEPVWGNGTCLGHG